jgi:hypothetical protein
MPGYDELDKTENQPYYLVQPSDYNIDPQTTRFAPLEYGGMLAQGIAGWAKDDLIPAITDAGESIGRTVHNMTLPGGDQYDPPADPNLDGDNNPFTNPKHELNQPAKESKPLIAAIESGYADKKVLTPYQMIREGIQKGDMDMVDKGQKKLVDVLSGNMSWGERYADAYLRQGRMVGIRKMAADVVMKEMMRPSAVDAVNQGLIEPSELLPGQTQPTYGNLIPAAGMPMTSGFDPDVPSMPLGSSIQESLTPAQPGQGPMGMAVRPDAMLTDLQNETVDIRNKGEGQALAWAGRGRGTGAQPTPSTIAKEGIAVSKAVIQAKHGRPPTPEEEEQIYKEWSGLENKQDILAMKQGLAEVQKQLMQATADMRGAYGERARGDLSLLPAKQRVLEARARLEDARTDFVKQQPKMAKDLQAMRSTNHPQHEVFQAIQRVRQALEKGEQPNQVDSALFKSFIMRGGGEYRANFLGKLYDAYTGEYVTPELEGADKAGIVDVMKKYLGNLFGMLDADKKLDELDELVPEQKPAAPATRQPEMPSPKTPEEAAKLKPGTRYKTPDGKVMVR